MKATELFSVRDLSVVVTGGANGLGSAFARAMADNGAQVTLFDLDGEAAAAKANELGRNGGATDWLQLDLTNKAALAAAFATVMKRRGKLDVLFANAGIVAGPGFLNGDWQRAPAGAIENIPLDLWRQVQNVNLKATFSAIQASVPYMKQNGGGRIIVTSSTASLRVSPAVGVAYGVTKAGLNQLVRQLAVELASLSIRVNAILPGPFQTRITTPEMQAAFNRASPVGRAAELHEIEGLALLLASNASNFMTGGLYPIDGGLLLGKVD